MEWGEDRGIPMQVAGGGSTQKDIHQHREESSSARGMLASKARSESLTWERCRRGKGKIQKWGKNRDEYKATKGDEKKIYTTVQETNSFFYLIKIYLISCIQNAVPKSSVIYTLDIKHILVIMLMSNINRRIWTKWRRTQTQPIQWQWLELVHCPDPFRPKTHTHTPTYIKGTVTFYLHSSFYWVHCRSIY